MQLAAGENLKVLSGYDTNYVENYIKEIQYGMRLDARQTLTQGVKDTITSVYDSFKANNKGEEHEAKRFETPNAMIRIAANYTGSITASTNSSSKVVSSSLQSGGNMELDAQNDINLAGAKMTAIDSLTLAAGNNVNITSAEEVETATYNKNRHSVSDPMSEQYKGKQSEKTITVTNVGSVLGGNEVTISAGNDIDVTGSTIASITDMNLSAGSNVNIGTVQNSSHSVAKTGEYGIDHSARSFVAGTKTTESTTTMDIGSTLVTGGNMRVNAGSGIYVKASGLYAGGDIDLNDSGGVTIAAGEARHEEKTRNNYAGYSETTTATEDKISSFHGVNYTHLKKDNTESVALASNVSAGGNLNINSGDGDVAVRGSNLDSGQDIAISAARDINFEVADQITKLDEHGLYAQIGALAEAEQTVTGTLRKAWDKSSAAVKSIKDIKENHEVDDIIGLIEAIDKANSAIENVAALKDGINVSIKVGGKIGVEDVKITKDNNIELASTAKAGGDINLDAIRDVNMRGTQLAAGNDVNINAGENLNIHASLDKRDEYSRTTKGSAFAGFGGQTGTSGTAFDYRGEVGAGYGDSKNKSKIYTNAQVSAGQGLNVATGGNAEIIGGNLRGDDVNMDVGGNLTLASLQNDIKITNTKSGVDVGFTFGFGAAGGSGASGGGADRGKSSGSAEYSKMTSNFVGRQSTIEGTSKVDVYVDCNTHLKGSMINSGNGNLKLNTDTLSYEDIKSTEFSWKVGGGLEVSGTSSKQYDDKICDNIEEIKKNREQKKAENSGGSGESSGESSGDSGDKSLWDKTMDAGGTAAGWVLDNWLMRPVVGGVADFSAWSWDQLEPVDNYLKHMKTRPINVKFGYKKREQFARATVGAGEITIRSNPGQDLSGLNRDPQQSFEEKDKYIFRVNSIIKLKDLDIDMDDPVATGRRVIRYINKTQDVTSGIRNSGGVKNYIQNKTGNANDK